MIVSQAKSRVRVTIILIVDKVHDFKFVSYGKKKFQYIKHVKGIQKKHSLYVTELRS